MEPRERERERGRLSRIYFQLTRQRDSFVYSSSMYVCTWDYHWKIHPPLNKEKELNKICYRKESRIRLMRFIKSTVSTIRFTLDYYSFELSKLDRRYLVLQCIFSYFYSSILHRDYICLGQYMFSFEYHTCLWAFVRSHYRFSGPRNRSVATTPGQSLSHSSLYYSVFHFAWYMVEVESEGNERWKLKNWARAINKNRSCLKAFAIFHGSNDNIRLLHRVLLYIDIY